MTQVNPLHATKLPDDVNCYQAALDAAFAAGVEAEREACAKVCDDIDKSHWGCEVKASWCSKAIRARGERQ